MKGHETDLFAIGGSVEDSRVVQEYGLARGFVYQFALVGGDDFGDENFCAEGD